MDDMVILDKNLNELKKRQGDIYLAIKEGQVVWDERKASVEHARNGEPIVVYTPEGGRPQYINSRYNSTHEAEKYMEDAVDLAEMATLVIFGFANGAYVRQYMEKCKKNGTHCIVYEPSVDIFMRVMHDIDISDILADERVWIVVDGINKERFDIFLQAYILSANINTNKHLALPKYQQLFEEQCHEMIRILHEKYDDLQIEKNTINAYGERICYTGIQNMCFLPGCRSGAEYIQRFPKDLPAIVVAAGPSLEKNVEMLRKAKGRALILVVDSAIRTVMGHGIMPDMVISIDNHKAAWRFDVPGLSGVPMLGDMAMNTAVLELVRPKDLIFYSADSAVWDRLFREEGSEIRMLYAGGSVAIDAMANLIEWGFQTIIMIGQDLMFTNNRVHAGEDALVDGTYKGKKMTTVKDIYGNEGLTSMDYFTFIRSIERLAFRYSDIRFVDATEGGAYKENTEIMTLEEAIQKYCVKEYDIESIIYGVPRLFEGERKNKIKDTLLGMRKNLDEFEKLLTRGVVACRKGSKLLNKGDYDTNKLRRVNELLAEVDARYDELEESGSILKYASKEFYNYETDFYIEEEDDIKESIRLYDKTAKYYQSMSDAIPPIIQMIDEALERWNQMYEVLS